MHKIAVGVSIWILQLMKDWLCVFCSSRSAPGIAIAHWKAVCVCSAQSPDGRPAVEASRPSGFVSTGVGFVSEGPLSASTGMR